MKKTLKERIDNAREAFFADENYAPDSIAVRENDSDLQNQIGDAADSGSFNVWAFTTYFLFYLPGVSLLFYVTLVLTHFIIFKNENIGDFTFAFFWLGFGAFTTMFGIGKLSNLKYLKVVAAILISSFVIALPFFFVFDVLKRGYPGIYAFYFLPVIMFVGYLAKKWIDQKDAELL